MERRRGKLYYNGKTIYLEMDVEMEMPPRSFLNQIKKEGSYPVGPHEDAPASDAACA